MPAFAAPYGATIGSARKLAPDEMFTIAPLPCSIIGFATRRDEEPHAGEVEVDDLVPLRRRPVLGGLVDAAAGVVHEHVDPTELGHRCGDETFALCVVGDVGLHHDRLAAECFDLAGRALEQLRAPCREPTSAPCSARTRAVARPIPVPLPVTIATMPSSEKRSSATGSSRSSGSGSDAAWQHPVVGYHRMDDDAIRAFLTAAPARPAVLATTRKDGRPHVAPIWYVVDDVGTILFTTGADTVKGRTLAGPVAPGCASTTTDRRSCSSPSRAPSRCPTTSTRSGTGPRRSAADTWAPPRREYGACNGVPGELLVRLTPERVIAVFDVAD